MAPRLGGETPHAPWVGCVLRRSTIGTNPISRAPDCSSIKFLFPHPINFSCSGKKNYEQGRGVEKRGIAFQATPFPV